MAGTLDDRTVRDMTRSTAAPVIAHTRTLLADPDSQRWTDTQILDALDAVADDVVQMPLNPVELETPAGVTRMLWTARHGWWETESFADAANWASLTPTVADDVKGRWAFATSPRAFVAVTGVWHDPAAAAADLLDGFAMNLELAGPMEYKIGDTAIDRVSQIAAIRAQANRLRSGARNPVHATRHLPEATTGTLVRDDTGPWW